MDINEPEVGFYRRKLVRDGPWVPVRIWWDHGDREDCEDCKASGRISEFGPLDAANECPACDGVGSWLVSDDILKAEVDGAEADPFDQWTWVYGEPITEAEFNYMRAGAAWDRDNDPEAPAANPRREIDISKTRPLF